MKTSDDTGLVPRPGVSVSVDEDSTYFREQAQGCSAHTERRAEWLKHGITTHFPLTGMQGFGSVSDPPFSQVSYSVLFVFYFVCTTIFCLQTLGPPSLEDLLKYPLVSLSLVSPGFCPLLEPIPDTSS